MNEITFPIAVTQELSANFLVRHGKVRLQELVRSFAQSQRFGPAVAELRRDASTDVDAALTERHGAARRVEIARGERINRMPNQAAN